MKSKRCGLTAGFPPRTDTRYALTPHTGMSVSRRLKYVSERVGTLVVSALAEVFGVLGQEFLELRPQLIPAG